MVSPLSTLLQMLAILLVSLVVGSMFGIWQGYVLADYSPGTFVEVHQGAVRGLNVLLPALAGGSLAATVFLAYHTRGRRPALILYLVAAALILAGGIVTRVFNQPINAQVMSWSVDRLPQNWQELRDSWWVWHIVRFIAALCGEVVLIAAVFADRRTAPTLAP